MPVLSAHQGNGKLKEIIEKGAPASIGKIGASELKVLNQFLLRLQGETPYDKSVKEEIFVHSGVFPTGDLFLDRYAAAMLEALSAVNLLAVWYNSGEREIVERACSPATLCELTGLEPYYFSDPWTSALRGKRVLVISPFIDSIRGQYLRRSSIWKANPDVLPDFDLITLACPQSPALVPAVENDWFVVLESLTNSIAKEHFDVALIGAGALSIPLCASIKSAGKIAVHLGGQIQILFGIKGRRWDTHPTISKMFNETWIRTLPHESPPDRSKIENGAYW
ncbi:hypothetical protein IVB57_07465 [Bradyrhizobium sp. CW9]|uniref:hypothetical protein n=1 Tax=Bradyrhizobium sp. CW9 TaxID=2782689 RepID=UPI001FF74527|nr:hypothetical protein [Bradyrhizobium sp. CW9]MCK1328232.1 hypothetical protein [Bradyrhizobium sp. CW9]